MRLPTLICISSVIALNGCTTTPVDPVMPPTAQPPGWTSVPHPAGFDLADIEAIFLAAPPVAQTGMAARPMTRQEVASCDRPYRVLKEKTVSKSELLLGIRELVRTDPVTQHWCFYGKILELEQKLKEPERLLKGRQELVLDTFGYLTPVARAFHDEMNDSRYWRWAIQRYRWVSDRVFFQRVEPSAETTSVLVTAADPFAWVRPGASSGEGILQKYGLIPPAPSVVLPPTAPSPTSESSLESPPQEGRGASVPASPVPSELEDDSGTYPALEDETAE